MRTDLVIHAPNWLGDTLLARPFVAQLVSEPAQGQVVVVAHPRVAPVWRAWPGLQVLETRPGPWLADALATAGRLRKLGRFAEGYLLSASFRSAATFTLAGIPARIGFATGGRSWLLTRPVARLPAGSMHYGQEFFRLLPKGCTGQVPVPELAWPETAGSRAAALLGGCGVYGGPYAVVAVGAAGGAKRYPPSAWRAVVRRLCTRLPVVVVGTESEVPLASAAGAGEERGVHNLCGATGLPELAALLAGAAGFVGVDSGAAHLAAAVGCPVVVLFGPGDPLETAPAGKDVRILRDGLWCSPCRSRTCLRPLHASECMDRIAPERVAFTLLAALRPVAR